MRTSHCPVTRGLLGIPPYEAQRSVLTKLLLRQHVVPVVGWLRQRNGRSARTSLSTTLSGPGGLRGTLAANVRRCRAGRGTVVRLPEVPVDSPATSDSRRWARVVPS